MPTQVSAMLGSIVRSAEARELPYGVFGSYGWSGESVDMLSGKLVDSGFQAAFAPIKVQFRPDAKALQVCEESGTDLAQLVLKKKRSNAKQMSEKSSASARSMASGAPDAAAAFMTPPHRSNPFTLAGAEAAMGRVVGSLCVVTAKDGDAESAMLASWISQASFRPPGVSVAVKKDRATESLLVRSSKFNVNVLAEGRERAVMKVRCGESGDVACAACRPLQLAPRPSHLAPSAFTPSPPTPQAVLKPFAPGEFRFEGVEHSRSEDTGCVELSDAVSVLQCTVQDRLDAGDHWVVYGQVDAGHVLDETAVAAVHHRRDGTTY